MRLRGARHRGWVATGAVLVYLLSSCRPLVNLPDLDGKVLLTIRASGGTARTVVHEAPLVASYVLDGAPSGDTQAALATFDASLTDATVALEPGLWDFTLRALDASANVVLEGTQNGVNLTSTAATITFTLRTLTTGTGTVEVTVGWPLTVNVASVDATFNGAPAATTSGDHSVTYTNPAAPAGDRILVLRMYDTESDLMCTVFELVWVRANLQSQGSIELGAEDFNSAPDAPTGFGAAAVPDTVDPVSVDVDLAWTDSSYTETGFELEYADDGVTWMAEAAVAPTTEAHSTTAPRGVHRTYRIRSVNDFGVSDWVEAAVDIPWLVSFVSAGGSAVAPREVMNDALVGAAVTTRAGWVFDGWYRDEACTLAWDLGTDTVTSNLTLYAGWVECGIVQVSFSLPSYVVFRYQGSPVTTLDMVRGGTLTLSYDAGVAATSWQWYVNGAPVGTGTGTYDLDISHNGRYVVSCVAVYNGVRYAGSLTVTVSEGLSVSYGANGATSGTPPLDNSPYVAGDDVTVLANPGGLQREGYTWLGWSLNPLDTSPADYEEDDVYADITASITFYAVWGADTTPPAPVTGLGATTGVGSVTLSWTDPTDSDLAGVCVEYYGATAGSVLVAKGDGDVTIGEPDIVDGSPYTFHVFAYDEAGNYSAGAEYWACPGGAVESDFDFVGGVITGYDGGGDLVIPGSVGGVPVTAIGDTAFQNCVDLTSVTIPDSVITIGASAFRSCTGLDSVTIPDSVTSIGDYGFYGCTGLDSVTIPDSVTTIGAYGFLGCIGLTTVAIPDSVTSIGRGAFWNCTGLTSVAIPDSLTSIGDLGFYGCTGLTSVTIPDSVTSIGEMAFQSCAGLTSVTIPDSVSSIGNHSFDGCTKLTTVTIPDSVTSVGNAAFQGCTGLTSVTIPDSVTYLGAAAFYHCTGLTTVTIPDSVTLIGERTFEGCTGLTSVTIPDSVVSIVIYAFLNCTGLTSITIPHSVTSIGGSAFYGCTALASVYVNAITPPTLGANPFFNNAGGRIIYVPASADDSVVDAYRAAPNWSTYAASIQERP